MHNLLKHLACMLLTSVAMSRLCFKPLAHSGRSAGFVCVVHQCLQRPLAPDMFLMVPGARIVFVCPSLCVPLFPRSAPQLALDCALESDLEVRPDSKFIRIAGLPRMIAALLVPIVELLDGTQPHTSAAASMGD